MKPFFLLVALGLVSLTACGGDDDGGGSGGSSTGGSSTGGTGGSSTGGTAGSGGGTAGSGGSSTGGTAGSGGSSTGGSGGSSTGGSGGSSTGGTGGTGGSSACNALVNDGADIPESAQTGTPPTMTGGSVTDGTYVLTSRKDWQGSCGCTTRQKILVSGGKIQLVTRTDSKPDQHMSATATFASNKLSLAVDCPTAAKQEHTYTATATELQIFSASDQALSVYTKK
ncbi:MAG: hypothetical protein IT375_12065 [Polyangiaceae bacterium]|nr:hypothetical protein [Polyangiaceae bacterium]